jgi:hypothetical protein
MYGTAIYTAARRCTTTAGVYLTGVCLLGVYLTDVHLTGVDLMA